MGHTAVGAADNDGVEYFGHGFGHGLGVEVHEGLGAAPTSDKPLPAGAVVSAEPGIYIPGKFGVRIEDIMIIGETGSRSIMLPQYGSCPSNSRSGRSQSPW